MRCFAAVIACWRACPDWPRRSWSKPGGTLNLTFRRIQFTPDLMPSDITGTDIIQEDPQSGRRQLEFMAGPIFTNLLLADEINRTPPKTQAALLEAMQERRTTCRGRHLRTAQSFFRAGNPEPHRAGRHLHAAGSAVGPFHVHGQGGYPTKPEEIEILKRTTGDDAPEVKALFSAQEILQLQRAVRRVPVAEHVYEYVVSLVHSTRPGVRDVPDATKWLRWGAGPAPDNNSSWAAKPAPCSGAAIM